MRSFLRLLQLYKLDRFSLRLFRVALGAAVCSEFIHKWAIADPLYYLEFGRTSAPSLAPWNLVAAWLTSPASMNVAILVGIGLGLLLAVGVMPLLSTLGALLLVTAFTIKYPYLSSDDKILTWILCASLLANLSEQQRRSARWLEYLSSVLLTIQLAGFLFSAGFTKLGSRWFEQPSSLSIAMLGSHRTAFGVWITEHFPGLVDLLSGGVPYFEIAVGVCLCIPLNPVRIVALISAFLSLAALNLCMEVGNIPLYTAIPLIALIPSSVWRSSQLLAAASGYLGPRDQRQGSGSAEPHSQIGGFSLLTALNLVRITIGCVMILYVITAHFKLIVHGRDAYRPANVTAEMFLRQRWNLFAPRPPETFRDISMWGTDERGRRFDLLDAANGPFAAYRTRTARKYYNDHIWFNFLFRYAYQFSSQKRSAFNDRICRKWERASPQSRLIQVVSYRFLRDPLSDRALTAPEQFFRFRCR